MSTPTSNPEAKIRLSDAQKKHNHIVSEQKRREAIRQEFDRLAALIPGMEGQGRSEAAVLQATVNYMREQLQRKEELRAAARRKGMSDDAFEKYYDAVEQEAKKNVGKVEKGDGEGTGGLR